MVQGDATFRTEAQTLHVDQSSRRAVYEFERFDIDAGEQTRFNQPDRRSLALGLITNDANGSQIHGRLDSNGRVALINPAGILVGPSGVVNTAGFIAATHLDASKIADLNDEARALAVALGPARPGAAIVNRGRIEVGAEGRQPGDPADLVALIGPEVIQAGHIAVEDGKILLAAGATITLLDDTGLEFGYRNSSGAYVDLGAVVREGGAAGLRAALVRHGSPGATRAVSEAGEIRLVGGGVEFTGRSALSANVAATVESANRIDLAGSAELQLQGESESRITRLRAAADVSFGRDARIVDSPEASGGTLELSAGADLEADDPSAVRAGAPGSVYLSGSREVAGATVEQTWGGEVSLEGASVAVRASGDLVLGGGGGLVTRSGRVDVEVGGDVRFRLRERDADTRIETATGDIRVRADGDIDLGALGIGNAAIRTRGERVADAEGTPTGVRRSGGDPGAGQGDIFLWAGGDIDAGRGNRWLAVPPKLRPETINEAAGRVVAPDFDKVPVHPDGILGIGSEAGGRVTLVAGGDVRTRESTATGQRRSGGSASGLEGRHDGSHVGVFGQERELVPIELPFVQSLLGGEYAELPIDAPDEHKLLVIAGGNIEGDVMLRDGLGTLRAGYALSEAGETEAAQGTLPLSSEAVDALLVASERSEAFSVDDPFPNGWLGTAANPLTIDLVADARIDGRARNGSVLRAIENPSLVYFPFTEGSSARLSTFGELAAARIEAERGDIALLGIETDFDWGTADPPSNAGADARILPPRLELVTHAFSRGPEGNREERNGDFLLLNDFVMAPSPESELTLDIAGEIRTANAAGSGRAALELEVFSTGDAANASQVLNPGTLFEVEVPDPSGEGTRTLVYNLEGRVDLQPRRPALAAQGTVQLYLDRERAREGITLARGEYDSATGQCSGTCFRTADGRLYVSTQTIQLPSFAERRSEGEVVFRADRPLSSQVVIEAGTLLQDSAGRRFRVQRPFVMGVGSSAAAVPVVALDPGFDARPGELELVRGGSQALPDAISATNLVATVRPSTIDLRVVAVEPGRDGNLGFVGELSELVNPIEGVVRLLNPAPINGGQDRPAIGLPQDGLAPPILRALEPGLVGLQVPADAELRPVTPGDLPEGVVVRVRGPARVTNPEDTAVRVATVYRKPRWVATEDGRGHTRLDPGTDAIDLDPELTADDVYRRNSLQEISLLEGRASLVAATLAQSDANPFYDARPGFRDPSATLDNYYRYFRYCRFGDLPACSAVENLRPDPPGSGPNRVGDPQDPSAPTPPARVIAGDSLRSILFDLATPGSFYTGGDAIDIGIVTQHTTPRDLTQLVAPYGSVVFGEAVRESGLLVSGPGLVRILAGVQPNAQALQGFGDRVLAGLEPLVPDGAGVTLSQFALFDEAGNRDVALSLAAFLGLDDRNGPGEPPDGNGLLTPGEAPFVPTGPGGTLRLSSLPGSLGLSTVGNTRYSGVLPEGGARLQVYASRDIYLGDQGSIATLQGGSLRLTSLAGGLLGGDPGAQAVNARGVLSGFARALGASAELEPDSGAGRITLDVHSDLNAGAMPILSLSSGDIVLVSREGSVRVGEGQPLTDPLVALDSRTRTPRLQFRGSGLLTGGNILILTRGDIDLGAGVTARDIVLDAGGDVLPGSGTVTAQNISVDAQSFTGNVSASNIQVSGGTQVGAGSTLSASGFVGGGGTAGASSNASKVSTETVARNGDRVGEESEGLERMRGGSPAPRTVLIDVSSRPCTDDECQP